MKPTYVNRLTTETTERELVEERKWEQKGGKRMQGDGVVKKGLNVGKRERKQREKERELGREKR